MSAKACCAIIAAALVVTAASARAGSATGPGPAAPVAAAPAATAAVDVTITDVRAGSGDLFVSLQGEREFMRTSGTAGTVMHDPAAGTVTVHLEAVPQGRYAVSVWHDTDGDGRFSIGPMGPTDGWAMIDAASVRGVPEFADHSFAMPAAGTHAVTVAMIYPSAR